MEPPTPADDLTRYDPDYWKAHAKLDTYDFNIIEIEGVVQPGHQHYASLDGLRRHHFRFSV